MLILHLFFSEQAPAHRLPVGPEAQPEVRRVQQPTQLLRQAEEGGHRRQGGQAGGQGCQARQQVHRDGPGAGQSHGKINACILCTFHHIITKHFFNLNFSDQYPFLLSSSSQQ